MNLQTLSIGNTLEVIPSSLVEPDLWVVDSASLPNGWSCSLIHRALTDVLPGQSLTAWILNVNEAEYHVEVSDSNFGFLPISDRMRPRYVTSLNRLAAILDEKDLLSGADADAISEVKGMYSRCARRDQWDWCAVGAALGGPPRDDARKLATVLGDISAALRCGDITEALAGLRYASAGGNLACTLRKASVTIRNKVVALPKSRSPGSQHSVPRQSRGKLVLSTYAKDKLDTANATHAMLLDVLGQFLELHGHRVEANQFIDAFARLKSGPALFEAKSVTDDNELAQIRQGLSQLYEYRYRHNLEGATLWLILSRAPKADWILNYLEKDRGVHLLWLEEGGQLSGPSVGSLLESGSQALRRQRDA